jgi:hypothetical protein
MDLQHVNRKTHSVVQFSLTKKTMKMFQFLMLNQTVLVLKLTEKNNTRFTKNKGKKNIVSHTKKIEKQRLFYWKNVQTVLKKIYFFNSNEKKKYNNRYRFIRKLFLNIPS